MYKAIVLGHWDIFTQLNQNPANARRVANFKKARPKKDKVQGFDWRTQIQLHKELKKRVGKAKKLKPGKTLPPIYGLTFRIFRRI